MNIRHFSTPSGYGALKPDTTVSFEPHQLNIILGPNEMGKSTLIQGILYTLFDLSSASAAFLNRFGLPKNHRLLLERFKPWGSLMPLQLEVELQCQGSLYRIQRELETKKTTVFNLSSGQLETKRFEKEKGRWSVGETLMGLSETAFLNTAFVCQNHLQAFEKADEVTDLVAEIQRTVENTPGDSTATQAIAKIDKALQSYQITGFKRHTNALAEMEEKQHQLEQDIAALTQLHERALQALEENKALHRAIQAQEIEIAQLEVLVAWAEYEELEKEIRAAHQLNERIAQCQETLLSLAELATFPIQHKERFLTQFAKYEEKNAQGARWVIEDQGLASEKARLQAQSSSEFDTVLPEAMAPHTQELLQKTGYYLEALLNTLDLLQAQQEALAFQGLDYETFQLLTHRYRALSLADKLFLVDYPGKVLAVDDALSVVDPQEWAIRKVLQQEIAAMAQHQKLSVLFYGLGSLFVVFSLFQHSSSLLGLGILGLFLGTGLWVYRSLKRVKQQRLEEVLESLSQEQNTLHETFTQLASLYGAQVERMGSEGTALSPEQISHEIQWLSQVDPSVEKELETLVQQQQHQQVVLAQHLQPLFEQGILKQPPADLSFTQAALRQLNQQLLLGRHWRECLHRQAQCQQAQEALKTEQAPLQSELREILSLALISDTLSLEAARDEFLILAQRYETFQQQQQQYEALLPQQLLSETLEQKQARQALLMRTINAEDTAAHPQPTQSSRYYLEALQEKRRLLDDMRKQASVSEIQVVEDREKVYHTLPGLQEELAILEEDTNRLRAFQEALFYAKEGLAALSAQSHRTWSTALNQRVGHILQRVNPRYGRLYFNESLSFMLEDTQTGKTLPMDEALRHLSVGAKDQLYFAIRLAILDQLTQDAGETGWIPLILDDPFVNCDDTRFRQGMDYLLSRCMANQPVSGQMLLLSCHAERYEAWVASLLPQERDAVHLLYLKDVVEGKECHNSLLEAAILSP